MHVCTELLMMEMSLQNMLSSINKLLLDLTKVTTYLYWHTVLNTTGYLIEMVETPGANWLKQASS